METWFFLLIALIATLILCGLVAAVTGFEKRRLAGTAEVAAELDTHMLDVDASSITVSENQRAALALCPDHVRVYLVHTHGDSLVTRLVDTKTLTCINVREGLRLSFGELGAAPVLLHMSTAMARHWQEILKVLKHA
jgi:hypothetical protein